MAQFVAPCADHEAVDQTWVGEHGRVPAGGIAEYLEQGGDVAVPGKVVQVREENSAFEACKARHKERDRSNVVGRS